MTVAGAVTGAPVSEQFTFAGVSLQNTFSTPTDGAGGTYLETSVACYVAGTLIATKNGEVAIERLVVGDLARTASVEEGHRLTRKADPNITVDGPNVEPIRLSETRLAFVLPAGGREIALRSNVFIPAHTVAESSDYRSLGLCIGGLQIDGSPVSLDSDATWGWAGMRLKSPTGASRIAGRMARRYFPAARGSSSSIWRT